MSKSVISQQSLQTGFIFCFFATMIVLCYHFRTVEWLGETFSWAIDVRKGGPYARNRNTNRGRLFDNRTRPRKISERMDATTASTGAGSVRNCGLDWNPNHLDLQSYERGANLSELKSLETNADFQPLYPNAKFVLNPDKFLLPALVWGPNNQLVGTREGIFTAIMLNRTFVIPRFKKHGYDKQRRISPFIAPVHRVDFESVCKFVSCITIDQFRKSCNGRVDAVMNTRTLTLGEIRQIEDTIQTQILPPDANDTSLLSNVLIPLNSTSERRRKFVFTAQDIKRLFSTPASCMVLPFPFLNLHGVRKSGQTNLHGMITDVEMQDKNATEDVQLMISIMRHSQHPGYLKNLSNGFQEHFMGDEPFLSVHWRYNAGDYLSSWNCANSRFMAKLCKVARNFTNEDFANRIEEKVMMLKAKNVTVKNVYIASPRNEMKRITAVAKIVAERQGLKTFTSLDLEKFMQLYNECDFLNEHSEDIISTVEMEICSKGVAFIGSDGSWSGNVRNARLFSNDPLLDKSRDDIFVV